jgi:hypothetical protein
MHLTVPVQPLLMCLTDEALDKLGAPYLDGSTGFVPMEHGGLIAVMSKYESQPSRKQYYPRFSMSVERHTYLEFNLMQSSMV